jgi:hypothetical protein
MTEHPYQTIRDVVVLCTLVAANVLIFSALGRVQQLSPINLRMGTSVVGCRVFRRAGDCDTV